MGCGTLGALCLIVVGVWIWASNYGIAIFNFYRDWPLLLVVVGVFVLSRLIRRRLRRPRV